MQYVHPETNQTVMKEKWCWNAVYADGRVLKQFDDAGVFHRIAEVDLNGLIEFRMVADNMQPIVMKYIPGTIIVHFYRNTRLAVGTNFESCVRLYCFGYKNPDGTGVLQAIYPDGSVRLLEG